MNAKKEISFLEIDRDQNPFDPVALLGDGFEFWRGPLSSDGRTGDRVKCDFRSLEITKLDLSKLCLENYFEYGEVRVPGFKVVERASQVCQIRLDLGIFQALWNNPHFLTYLFRDYLNEQVRIFFDGQTIRSPAGRPCNLAVGLMGGEPRVGVARISRFRTAKDLSITLPPSAAIKIL